MNERSNEICPDILGPSLLKQLKDRGEGIAWMQKMQAKRCVALSSVERVPIGSLPINAWSRITQDEWVIDTISKGYALEFLARRPELHQPSPSSRKHNESMFALMTEEVASLVSKGAVIEVDWNTKVWLSSMFVIPKKDGGRRPIINLSPLNRFLQKKHFKMESFSLVSEIIKKGYFLAKLDLKDAYFSIPIARESQNFLAFQWNGKLYRFRVLPFGLTSAPRVYTKVMRPVAAHLRSKGVRLIVYLDDWLIIGETAEVVLNHVTIAVNLFEELGLKVNYEKSHMKPVTCLEFLGFVISSVSQQISISEKKCIEIISLSQDLILSPTMKCAELAHFIGVCGAASRACSFIPLYLRFLQRDLIKALKGTADYNRIVELSGQSIGDLHWFRDSLHGRLGQSFAHHEPTITLATDASNIGWGACCEGESTGGSWNSDESGYHINVKETLAVLYGLFSFLYKMEGHSTVRIESDNITTVAYLNKGGGTSNDMLIQLTRRILELAYSKSLRLIVSHVPGVDNILADKESRCLRERDEWSLNPTCAEFIFANMGHPDLDLFASRHNAKAARYCSWKPDPGATLIDAFSHSWRSINAYAFPPFNLVMQVLKKALEEEVASLIIVAPIWKAQPFYLELNNHAQHFLVIPKPQNGHLLTNAMGDPHPCRNLCLGAWRILCPTGPNLEYQR